MKIFANMPTCFVGSLWILLACVLVSSGAAASLRGSSVSSQSSPRLLAETLIKDCDSFCGECRVSCGSCKSCDYYRTCALGICGPYVRDVADSVCWAGYDACIVERDACNAANALQPIWAPICDAACAPACELANDIVRCAADPLTCTCAAADHVVDEALKAVDTVLPDCVVNGNFLKCAGSVGSVPDSLIASVLNDLQATKVDIFTDMIKSSKATLNAIETFTNQAKALGTSCKASDLIAVPYTAKCGKFETMKLPICTDELSEASGTLIARAAHSIAEALEEDVYDAFFKPSLNVGPAEPAAGRRLFGGAGKIGLFCDNMDLTSPDVTDYLRDMCEGYFQSKQKAATKERDDRLDVQYAVCPDDYPTLAVDSTLYWCQNKDGKKCNTDRAKHGAKVEALNKSAEWGHDASLAACEEPSKDRCNTNETFELSVSLDVSTAEALAFGVGGGFALRFGCSAEYDEDSDSFTNGKPWYKVSISYGASAGTDVYNIVIWAANTAPSALASVEVGLGIGYIPSTQMAKDLNRFAFRGVPVLSEEGGADAGGWGWSIDGSAGIFGAAVSPGIDFTMMKVLGEEVVPCPAAMLPGTLGMVGGGLCAVDTVKGLVNGIKNKEQFLELSQIEGIHVSVNFDVVAWAGVAAGFGTSGVGGGAVVLAEMFEIDIGVSAGVGLAVEVACLGDGCEDSIVGTVMTKMSQM